MPNTNRPTRSVINSGLAAWDVAADGNDAKLFDQPLPIPELDDTLTEANLATNFPITAFGNCMARVQHSGLQDLWTLMITEGNARWQAFAQDLRCPFRTVTGTVTLNQEDTMILAIAGTPFTITLASAVACAGRTITVKQTGTGTVTLDGNGAQTIDGALTRAFTAQYQSVSLFSDGANWHVVGKN